VKGSRVKNIIEELRGEKIDVIRWYEDIKEFIKAALSPAIVSRIELNREEKRAKVLVAPDQLSLAIGKKGQNVRLASKLVGWEIDVRSKELIEAEIKEISRLKSVGKKVAATLVEAGFNNLETIAQASVDRLSKLRGIGKKKAENIIKEAKETLEENKEK
jgi:N utilization substance protein A